MSTENEVKAEREVTLSEEVSEEVTVITEGTLI